MAHLLIIQGGGAVSVIADPRPAVELAGLINAFAYSHEMLADPASWQAVASGDLVVVSRRATSGPLPASRGAAESAGAAQLTPGAPLPPIHISARQSQVLQLMVEGCTMQEVAVRLKISQRTLRAYVSLLKNRLGAASREQLLAIAVALGLVKPPL